MFTIKFRGVSLSKGTWKIRVKCEQMSAPLRFSSLFLLLVQNEVRRDVSVLLWHKLLAGDSMNLTTERCYRNWLWVVWGNSIYFMAFRTKMRHCRFSPLEITKQKLGPLRWMSIFAFSRHWDNRKICFQFCNQQNFIVIRWSQKPSLVLGIIGSTCHKKARLGRESYKFKLLFCFLLGHPAK